MKFKLAFSVVGVTLLSATVPELVCAQELGRVLSSTPLIQQIAVPRQICANEQVAVQQPKSGAGAVMGALAGGAIGNQIGRGAGQAAATMLGIVGGAMMGDHIEGGPAAQLETVQRCTTQTVVENRTMGYQVVYEYAGKQYSVQMPNDPGPTIALQVAPAGASLPNQPSAPVATTTVTVSPPPVVVGNPQPVYYYAPYGPYYGSGYSPYYGPTVNLRWGEWEHRRWR